ncbi:MAG TPA: class I SAM-dependent methyltransferase [candidate division Zixibacteria bacterium]|nr:class I SAM-dependent methyltransferase [candidate division Zixibacteria bacterium]
MDRRARDLIPPLMRRRIRQFYYFLIDMLDRLLSRRREMVPPKRIRPDYVVSSGFTEHGELFAQYAIELSRLEPEDRVLDLGCGIGRIAVPLTAYLNQKGSYEGLDIVPESIAWCRKEISTRHPNFNFQIADVYNNQYNPSGTQKAGEYTLPFDDGSFDLILLKSVFTHMLPDDVKNYLSEIARTLKNGGRVLITFFLLTELSLAAMENGSARREFNYVFDSYRTESDQVLESAIAYDESYVRQLFASAGLEIEDPIHYGTWTGRTDARFAQDIIVSAKQLGE